MEGQIDNIETPIAETPPTVAETPSIPVALDNQEELEQGGKFELVSFLLVVGFLSASLYSIYYHRQALNKLSSNSGNEALKSEIREVKTNLQKLMGSKYVATT